MRPQRTLTREREVRGVLRKVGLGGGGRHAQLHVRPRDFLRRGTQGQPLDSYPTESVYEVVAKAKTRTNPSTYYSDL